MGKKPPEALTVGEVFGRRVREERKRQGLSQEELVERLEAIGRPMERSNLGRIERGETTGQLNNLVALALALGVAPIHLMTPREDEGSVRLVDHTKVPPIPASAAREWIRGTALLHAIEGVPDSDPYAYFAAMSEREQEAVAMQGVSPLVLAASGDPGWRKRATQQMRDAVDDVLSARKIKEDTNG